MAIDRKQMSTVVTTAVEKLREENPSAGGALLAAAATAAGLRFLADRLDELERRLDEAPVKYMGVYTEGHVYAKGSLVTHAGSLWHANHETRERPGASASFAWTLCVKRGADGKDLR